MNPKLLQVLQLFQKLGELQVRIAQHGDLVLQQHVGMNLGMHERERHQRSWDTTSALQLKKELEESLRQLQKEAGEINEEIKELLAQLAATPSM